MDTIIRQNKEYKKTFFILALFISVSLFLNCGKKADDLYSEGQKFLSKEETFDEGIRTLQTFIEKFPKERRAPEVTLTIAISYQNQGRTNEAIQMYQKLIQLYPSTAEAYKGMFLLCYLYYEGLKDYDKAGKNLTLFIKTYPDSVLAASAKILLDNLGTPIEKWSVVRKIHSDQNTTAKKP